MSNKITALEMKQYLDDKEFEHFPGEEEIVEEDVYLVNGREIYGDEIFQIADNISIRIIEGWVVGIDKSVKLLTSFMKWRSRQTRRVAKIFIPRDKESELNSFLESIGGREIGKCKV